MEIFGETEVVGQKMKIWGEMEETWPPEKWQEISTSSHFTTPFQWAKTRLCLSCVRTCLIEVSRDL